VGELIVADEHVQIFDLWRERGERGLRIAHVDFHCDMRGLLVDRGRGAAWLVDRSDPRVRIVDSGNFLAHAVAQGIVGSVRWIHDAHGGRRYDIGTVKYESDLTALPHRILHRMRGGAEAPIEFEETTLDAWTGLRPGEELDVDWDALASTEYDAAKAARLAREFLDRDLGAHPERSYLVYSRGYSHPDRSLFDRFAEQLAGKLGAEIRRLPPSSAEEPARSAARRGAEAVERAVVLGLRRIGIY
jgi:hypothetical protein